jgi:hypothetical protein
VAEFFNLRPDFRSEERHEQVFRKTRKDGGAPPSFLLWCAGHVREVKF